MRDFLQILKVQGVKIKPELAVPVRGRSEHDPGTNERVPKPSAGQASPSIFPDAFCPAKHSMSCVRYLSKTDSVRDFPQNLKVEDAKTKLGCEISWLLDLLAVRSLGCEIFGCGILAVRSLGCEISWLRDPLAVRSLGCETSWL